MNTIPTVLPPIEIENNKHFPQYFELLQNVLLAVNIDVYTQAVFEEKLYFSNEIYFFPPINSNVKLASKTECGYAIFNNNYHYHIVWYIPLMSKYIQERLGSVGEGISFAFLFEWVNERKVYICKKRLRKKC